MMKSRGLRPANCARIALHTSLRAPRQFSTNAPLKASALLRFRGPSLGARSPLVNPAFHAPLVMGSAASTIRFASTAPAAAAPAANATTQAAADAANTTSSSLEGVTDDFLASIANMPEQIGYLKAIGLDYGWGPTACIEWLLEHVHIWTHTPWWLSIGLTAVIIRASLFKLFATTSDITARTMAMKEVTQPIQQRMNEARIQGDSAAMLTARAELMGIYKQAGINPLGAFYAPVAQGVMGYCSWKLLRAMAALPVPGLETGGLLWIKDLTMPDPYYLIPIAFGSLMHYLGKRGGETGAAKQLTGLQRKMMLYLLPAFAIIFTVAQPAAVQLSFFISSTLGFAQSAILRNPDVRERLGLAPLPYQPGDGRIQQPQEIETTARITPGRPIAKFKYEAPTVKSSVQDAGRISEENEELNVLEKAKKSYLETRKELKDFKDGVMKRAGYYNDGRKVSREFLRRAEEYEKRRKAEEQAEKALKKRRS